MPRVDIWIRQEDWETWKKIGDKPAFIHDALNLQNSTLGDMYPKKEKEPEISPFVKKVIKTPAQAKKATEQLMPDGHPTFFKGKK